MVRELGILSGNKAGGESTWTNDLRVQGQYMGGVGVLESIGRTRENPRVWPGLGAGDRGDSVEGIQFNKKSSGEPQHCTQWDKKKIFVLNC